MSRVRGRAARPSVRAASRPRPARVYRGRAAGRSRGLSRITRPYAPLPQRRRPYRRHWRGGRGAAWPHWIDDYPIETVDEPGWIDDQPDPFPYNLPGFSAGAGRVLNQLGFRRGNWPRRLASADPEFRRFINRFYDVAGVHHLIEAYFAGRYQRAAARLAIRLSERLATRHPDLRRVLHFDRRIAFAPDGQPILTLAVEWRGIHYHFFPWRRLYPAALRRQLRRDRLVFGSPDRVRWVFGRGLAPSAGELAGQIRRALSGGRSAGRSAPPLSNRQIVLL